MDYKWPQEKARFHLPLPDYMHVHFGDACAWGMKLMMSAVTLLFLWLQHLLAHHRLPSQKILLVPEVIEVKMVDSQWVASTKFAPIPETHKTHAVIAVIHLNQGKNGAPANHYAVAIFEREPKTAHIINVNNRMQDFHADVVRAVATGLQIDVDLPRCAATRKRRAGRSGDDFQIHKWHETSDKDCGALEIIATNRVLLACLSGNPKLLGGWILDDVVLVPTLSDPGQMLDDTPRNASNLWEKYSCSVTDFRMMFRMIDLLFHYITWPAKRIERISAKGYQLLFYSAANMHWALFVRLADKENMKCIYCQENVSDLVDNEINNKVFISVCCLEILHVKCGTTWIATNENSPQFG